jgi:HPr kinase/phosphorylase
MTKTTVGAVYDLLRNELELQVAGDSPTLGRERPVENVEVSSPGLVLAGYVERFPAHRLQVFGETEISYLASLPDDERAQRLELFFSFPVPCVFVTKSQKLPQGMLEAAGRAQVPVFVSAHKTSDFYSRAKLILEAHYAPSTTLHGSLADVFGVGLLFMGRSGIGKSECVLDLVERGHRLVADDLVIVTRRLGDVLIAHGHPEQRHYMEIRGVGLIDVPAIFGIRAVRQQKRIEVVVQLADWQEADSVDRTGLDASSTEILGVEIPKIMVPLNPGKNITVIAEVIAMNHLLHYSGVNPAEQFNQRLIRRMAAAAEVRQYLQEDHE